MAGGREGGRRVEVRCRKREVVDASKAAPQREAALASETLLCGLHFAA